MFPAMVNDEPCFAAIATLFASTVVTLPSHHLVRRAQPAMLAVPELLLSVRLPAINV